MGYPENNTETTITIGVYPSDSYGTPYFWCKLPDIGISFNDRIIMNRNIWEWCLATYGPEQSWTVKNRRWFGSNRKFYFLNEQDRTLFMLKWAS